MPGARESHGGEVKNALMSSQINSHSQIYIQGQAFKALYFINRILFNGEVLLHAWLTLLIMCWKWILICCAGGTGNDLLMFYLLH